MNPMQFSSNISAEITQRLKAAISDAQIEVIAGSARHYEIHIISAFFEGLTPIKQQQMVYAPINASRILKLARFLSVDVAQILTIIFLQHPIFQI
jgi:acid stress-induced BolA-like protein IbaG/YrbA